MTIKVTLKWPWPIFTARRYASAVYAATLCLSVRPCVFPFITSRSSTNISTMPDWRSTLHNWRFCQVQSRVNFWVPVLSVELTKLNIANLMSLVQARGSTLKGGRVWGHMTRLHF